MTTTLEKIFAATKNNLPVTPGKFYIEREDLDCGYITYKIRNKYISEDIAEISEGMYDNPNDAKRNADMIVASLNAVRPLADHAAALEIQIEREEMDRLSDAYSAFKFKVGPGTVKALIGRVRTAEKESSALSNWAEDIGSKCDRYKRERDEDRIDYATTYQERDELRERVADLERDELLAAEQSKQLVSECDGFQHERDEHHDTIVQLRERLAELEKLYERALSAIIEHRDAALATQRDLAEALKAGQS